MSGLSEKRRPYRFHKHHTRPIFCIYCVKELEENQWVIQRGFRASQKHLSATIFGHVAHTDHIVDAKGDYIYPKRYRNW